MQNPEIYMSRPNLCAAIINKEKLFMGCSMFYCPKKKKIENTMNHLVIGQKSLSSFNIIIDFI